jgi:hypothetical protein
VQQFVIQASDLIVKLRATLSSAASIHLLVATPFDKHDFGLASNVSRRFPFDACRQRLVDVG